MPWHLRATMNSSNRPICMVAFDHSFDRISKVDIPFDFPSGSAQIVSFCNGLLCLADIASPAISDNVIYLWNPQRWKI